MAPPTDRAGRQPPRWRVQRAVDVHDPRACLR